MLQLVPQALHHPQPLDATTRSSLQGIDLFLNFIEQVDGAFGGVLVFNASIFEKQTVDNFLLLFTKVLDCALKGALDVPLDTMCDIRSDHGPDPAPSSASACGSGRLHGGASMQMQSHVTAEHVRHASLVVAGSFTIDVMEARLRQTAQLLGTSLAVKLAGFGQVMQSLLDVTSEFYANTAGLNILFVRAQDLLDARELSGALRQYDRDVRATSPLCLVICPQADAAHDWALDVESCAKIWRVDAADFCDWDASDFDEQYDQLMCIPYSERLYAALADLALRVASYITRRPFKIVCVDCDNTLWRGVVAEDGPDALQPNLELQRRLKLCSKRGLLLVTCSKNVFADVQAAFQAHPEWPLGLSDFALHKVNWKAKSVNVRDAAAELRISELQAVVFIDDNPVEIAEVQSSCPEVTTINVPEDFTSKYWHNCWALDSFRVTKEDANKTSMVRAELQRKHATKSMTFADFIDALNLKISTSLMTTEQLPRVLQMTQKTNQFNFTTERLT
eukprot:7006212-Prymnesium_polylepis.2